MKNYINLLRKKLWLVKQPLVHIPKLTGASVSDLFIWRNSDTWNTFFELTDISGLFLDREEMSERYVTLCFFDHNGTMLLEERLDLLCNQRQTLDLSVFLSKTEISLGTFCVFHSHTPRLVSDLGAFIAERGYVGYCFNEAPLRSYVHGNLDAIASSPNKSMQLLGSSSFRLREYRLQHQLLGPALYEFGVVNPSSRDQLISLQLLSTFSGDIMSSQEVELPPKGCYVFTVQVHRSRPCRIMIKSHLIMARPLVFRTQNRKLDVFHG